ncbi:hypothetical protein TNCV_908051 [Trichonephila clavipes]|nr:hypothetical protein TNCV_908051 [Trichonephila clavipes]
MFSLMINLINKQAIFIRTKKSPHADIGVNIFCHGPNSTGYLIQKAVATEISNVAKPLIWRAYQLTCHLDTGNNLLGMASSQQADIPSIQHVGRNGKNG